MNFIDALASAIGYVVLAVLAVVVLFVAAWLVYGIYIEPAINAFRVRILKKRSWYPPRLEGYFTRG